MFDELLKQSKHPKKYVVSIITSADEKASFTKQ